MLAGQCRLADPEQLLGRGFTLTMDSEGRLLKSVAGIEVGQRLCTRFRDGQIESEVSGANPAAGSPGKRRKEAKRGNFETDPEQKSLFR
jgi:exonuclease VII large subunit